jgi:hypothetical protein
MLLLTPTHEGVFIIRPIAPLRCRRGPMGKRVKRRELGKDSWKSNPRPCLEQILFLPVAPISFAQKKGQATIGKGDSAQPLEGSTG